MRGASPCPCSSGRPYADCCRPFHTHAASPPTVEALMRSRYAAFALSEIDYLVETTHPGHTDAKEPTAELRESIRRVATAHKFTGLTLLDAREDGDTGQVLFRARVFKKGKDFSFTELSDFRRDDGRWKYLSGEFLEGAGWAGWTIGEHGLG